MKSNNKFIIIGFNGSGKVATATKLSQLGIGVGKIFRTTETLGNIYSLSSVVYDSQEINNIFDNQSYIFMKESIYRGLRYYEGLSFYEYQNNDVFIMTPDQFNMVPKFDDNVVFIWLDTNDSQRKFRYRKEKRKYDFASQEKQEKEYVHDFIDRINENKVIYFFNEEPDRVATIIYGMVKHPDLVDAFIENFN